jgi:hypothetical protein
VHALHVVLGAALLVLNAAAGVYGAFCWWRRRNAPGFWPLLRAGQGLVVVEALQGLVLLLQGKDLPPLHLVYGLTPILVAFVAEQLRLASADTVLQANDLESSRDVAALPVAEQRAIVAAILRRELGVMAASALVVTLLALRASGLF